MRKCSPSQLSHWSYWSLILVLLIIIISLLVSRQAPTFDTQYGKFAAQERRRRPEDSAGGQGGEGGGGGGGQGGGAGGGEPGVRLLCLVITSPTNYLTKAVHVAATWASGCSRLVFLSDDSEPGAARPDQLDILELPGLAGREKLWQKVSAGLVSVWRDYQEDFDFLIKADDDTFMVLDNLRYLLSGLEPGKEFVLGHLQHDRGVSYLSGGSGYVISQPAVRHLVEAGLDPRGDHLCRLPHPFGQEIEVYPNEDLQLGKCAFLLSIELIKSEISGESSFFPFQIERHLVRDLGLAWWQERTEECQDCVSPYLVSMHYVSPHMMYVLDYFTNNFVRHNS